MGRVKIPNGNFHGDPLVPFPRLFPERSKSNDLEPVKTSKWNAHFSFGNSVWEFRSTFQEIPFSRENFRPGRQNYSFHLQSVRNFRILWVNETTMGLRWSLTTSIEYVASAYYCLCSSFIFLPWIRSTPTEAVATSTLFHCDVLVLEIVLAGFGLKIEILTESFLQIMASKLTNLSDFTRDKNLSCFEARRRRLRSLISLDKIWLI